ncbi:hypothetical protein EDC01DRAFT_630638 [Geopyxis carbonaria]|nr:hypothetical protein EDC01DRAFT_630638 [Geopyxis carbonaria]
MSDPTTMSDQTADEPYLKPPRAYRLLQPYIPLPDNPRDAIDRAYMNLIFLTWSCATAHIEEVGQGTDAAHLIAEIVEIQLRNARNALQASWPRTPPTQSMLRYNKEWDTSTDFAMGLRLELEKEGKEAIKSKCEKTMVDYLVSEAYIGIAMVLMDIKTTPAIQEEERRLWDNDYETASLASLGSDECRVDYIECISPTSRGSSHMDSLKSHATQDMIEFVERLEMEDGDVMMTDDSLELVATSPLER